MGNVILLQDIMGQDARASIDAFCSSRKGVEHIGEIAGFLKEKFGQDIVRPGYCQGLWRIHRICPVRRRLCAVLLMSGMRFDTQGPLFSGHSLPP